MDQSGDQGRQARAASVFAVSAGQRAALPHGDRKPGDGWVFPQPHAGVGERQRDESGAGGRRDCGSAAGPIHAAACGGKPHLGHCDAGRAQVGCSQRPSSQAGTTRIRVRQQVHVVRHARLCGDAERRTQAAGAHGADGRAGRRLHNVVEHVSRRFPHDMDPVRACPPAVLALVQGLGRLSQVLRDAEPASARCHRGSPGRPDRALPSVLEEAHRARQGRPVGNDTGITSILCVYHPLMGFAKTDIL